MTQITAVSGVEVKDSRGRPTLLVTVSTEDESGTFAVPSGASVGTGEAVELRDPDGGMTQSIARINDEIQPALIGMDVRDQRALDETMIALDGTLQKSRLGGNSIIGVSIAAARAAAASGGVELFEHLRSLATIAPSREVPLLYSNYINGGKHADSPLSFQEHMLVPNVSSVHEALSMIEMIEQELCTIIVRTYGEQVGQRSGDEGGYVLPEGGPQKPFELLEEAIERAGYKERVMIAIDAAASSFCSDGIYQVGGERLSPPALGELYGSLSERFPLISIEDPFEEHATEDTVQLQAKLPQVRIVGDDLTVTSAERIRALAHEGAIQAVIIKPNQIGTLSETLDAMHVAREHDVDCIVSHRSGETMDTFVADLAYAFGAFGLKAGALRKEERKVKYERLAAIAH